MSAGRCPPTSIRTLVNLVHNIMRASSVVSQPPLDYVCRIIREVRALSTTNDANIELVRAFFDAIDHPDRAALARLCHPQYRMVLQGASDELTFDQFWLYVCDLHQALGDFRHQLTEFYIEGDLVGVRSRLRVMPSAQAPSTGDRHHPLTDQLLNMLSIRDGKVRELTVFPDAISSRVQSFPTR